jgi:hypothetical protein
MFLLKEHTGLPVVTSTAENSTRRDFKRAWKGYPPDFEVRKHAPSSTKGTRFTRFFSGENMIAAICYHSEMQTRLVLLLSTLLTIAIVHGVALEFFLYWKYLWLDIPMHLLGGVCVAFGYSVLPFFRINLPPKYRTFAWYLAFVFAVGVIWEIFEFVNGLSVIAGENIFTDTAGDLFNDLIGGCIGYAIQKRIQE